MGSKYVLAWVTALAGLMAAQSSSAMTVTIDGVSYNATQVTITDGTSPSGGGGTPPPSGGGGTPPPSGGGGTPPPSGGNTGGGTCNNSSLALKQVALPTSSGMYYFGNNQAIAFSFSGTAGQRTKISYNESIYGYGYTAKLMVISDCAGDLDYSHKPPYCYAYGSSNVIYADFSQTASSAYCKLTPGVTYYATIRNSNAIYRQPDVDSCPQGTTCGATITTNNF
ncbi:MAG: hypothetical protein ACU4EQ_00145 [Candidatus Nitrosoglobus sp.]